MQPPSSYYVVGQQPHDQYIKELKKKKKEEGIGV